MLVMIRLRPLVMIRLRPLVMIRLRLLVMIRSITLVFKNLSSCPKMFLVISPSNLDELLM